MGNRENATICVAASSHDPASGGEPAPAGAIVGCVLTLDRATRNVRIRIGMLAAVALAWVAGTVRLPSQGPELRWFKGNLHTHTTNSDGDSAPDAVARWYKERRYHFLALTDHNYFSDPQGLNAFLAAKDRFLLITGEEVTSHYQKVPIHVNAFHLRRTIEPFFGEDVLSTLQGNVDAIRTAGAVPSLNHPQFRWAMDAVALKGVRDLGLFEVYNGHPDTNDEWGLEEMWDAALTAGKELYGIAVDDAHDFKQFGPGRSNPGRGWVEVLSPELSEQAILAALAKGDFYASTGVRLEELERGARGLRFKVSPKGDRQYRTEFAGKKGRILATVTGVDAGYHLRPGDGYVRATITDSSGDKAWLQPVFPGRP